MKKDVTPLWRAVMVVLVRVPVLALALTLAPGGTARGQDAAPSLRLRMLAAEDARDASPDGLAPLLEGLRSPDAEIQRIAVRALGRFEDPSLIPHIAATLSATEASVRAEAANALAQACHAAASCADGARIIREALEREPHPLVRGALVMSIGRVKHATLAEWRAAEALVATALFPVPAGATPNASPAVLLNGLRGLLFLARQAPEKERLGDRTIARVAALAAAPPAPVSARGVVKSYDSPTNAAASRIRVLAMQVLRASSTDMAVFRGVLEDPDPAVRRAIMAAVFAAPGPYGALVTLSRGVADSAESRRAKDTWADTYMTRTLERDPSPAVRLEALRGYLQRPSAACDVVVGRLADASPHVVLMAIDGMVKPCLSKKAAVSSLSAIATGAKAVAGWRGRAHALVALAQFDRAAASVPAREAGRDRHPWVRMYAARALRHLVAPGSDRDTPEVAQLRALAADADVNVATAAIEALHATVGHAADAEYLAALARDDRASAEGIAGIPTGYELVLAAVTALDGTTRSEAAGALLDTLDRLTADRRETSRDPRVAILKWLASHGDGTLSGRVRPYVSDFDPEVAVAAAAFLQARAGIAVKASPQRLPRAPLPTDADLAALSTTKVVLQMADGSRVTIGLLPNEAPLNAFRFVRLAERGYFTGRTIHRVVPNFVVQSGSPGANEYAGDGPYSRDEVGMFSNADGTVGLSTRGRDTGDGQFYVNTHDNTRLDHTYTVFGVIASGRRVVDRWLEGDVIARVIVTR
jgi:cyclophilin family peptidyl-prolyl cis-trans isomerase